MSSTALRTGATPRDPGGPPATPMLDHLVGSARLRPADPAYALTREGLQALLQQQLLGGCALVPAGDGPLPARASPASGGEIGSEIGSENEGEFPAISQAVVDAMICAIDRRLSAQVDAILHHPGFQRLESAWRSLKFLVDRVQPGQNIRIHLLSLGKQRLMKDFEEAAHTTRSALYRIVYTAEYGQFGGQPYAAMVADYAFGPSAPDIELLRRVAAVAAMAHAPFLAAASAEFFGIDSLQQLPTVKDLDSVFEGPRYLAWNGLRDSDDARYLGLALPSFLLRLPYGPRTTPLRAFQYEERLGRDGQGFLWGNAAFALASRLCESFADYRWCANVVGPQGGGEVRGLPIHHYEAMGALQSRIPTEVLISERREFELSAQGFIPLIVRKNTDSAAFFSAHSVQRPRFFGTNPEGREAELHFRLGTQLPYMLVVSRLAHYIKVLQRENIGTWKERGDLENALNLWIRQYVADMDNPSPGVRSRRPLRQAQILVSDIDGEPGWYRVDLRVRPHFKYMGASFTLSLVGKLEKR